MDDRYPSTDEQQSVHLDFPYPDAERISTAGCRWSSGCWRSPTTSSSSSSDRRLRRVVVAWFAILFTGRYPRGLFDFVEGVLRWGNRVIGYAFVLVTDRYPPFSLS